MEANTEFLDRSSFTVKAEAMNLFQLLRNLEYPGESEASTKYIDTVFRTFVRRSKHFLAIERRNFDIKTPLMYKLVYWEEF